MKYVVLGEDKSPVHSLSEGGGEFKDLSHHKNLGVLLQEPYIVLDFDSEEESQIMYRIVEDLDIKCNVMKTRRGMHFWFKSNTIWTNSIGTRCAIGLHYDVRSWGKSCYTIVKKDGIFREWLRAFHEEEMDFVPAWLYPVGGKKLLGLKEGDGRNQTLFSYIPILQNTLGADKYQEIRMTIKIINRYIFAEPLESREIDLILRDSAFVPPEKLETNKPKETTFSSDSAYFDDEGKFKHNIFANALVKDLKVICHNGTFYIYKDGYYQKANSLIEQRMIAEYPGIKTSQRAEVLNYLRIQTNVEYADKNEYVLNLTNTRFDLRNNRPLEYTEDAIEFCRLPVAYDPEAYCEDLDKTLNKVFCNNQEVIQLFEEMLGYMLIRNCKFRKGFIFYGSGSNGKSTILNLLKTFIGAENCSTIELGQLGDRFKTAELENKMVNIGDDIDRGEISSTGVLKKLFTGESVTVERKGQDPFTLKSYAKQVFSCNELPRSTDKSFGMYSRLTLIPFNARFLPTDPDFDPFIEDKISTQESLSYLLNKAIQGLQRLLKNNKFTTPQCVTDALEEYKSDNSTVLSWIKDESISVQHLVSMDTHDLFTEFKDWCNRSNIKYSASVKVFHHDIETGGMGLVKKRVHDKKTHNNVWRFEVQL